VSVDVRGAGESTAARTEFPLATNTGQTIASRSKSSTRLLLVPTLNEELGLDQTLTEFEEVFGRLGGAPNVLVIDGFSTDRTREVARRHGAEFVMQSGHGKGAAIRTGLDWALEHRFDTVGVIDADATYPCCRLPALYGLLEMGSEVVVGVRRPDHPSGTSARALVHRVGNVALNLCAAHFSRGPIMDVCSGFWGVQTAVAPTLALESNGFEIESELFVKAFRRRLKVTQIPVDYRRRVGVTKLRAVRDGSRILLSILRHAARAKRSPLRPGSSGDGRPSGAPSQLRDGVPLRELVSLVLTLNPAHLLMIGPPEHYQETVAIAQGLAERRPGLETRAVTTLPTRLGNGRADDLAELSGRGAPSSPPVVVTLPEGPWMPKEFSSIVVDIPRSRRVVHLRSVSRRRRGPSDVLEGLLLRGPSLLTILGATIDFSGVQKEIALLRANSSDSSLEIFRTRPPTRPDVSSDTSRVETGPNLAQRWQT
jgi:hypothetical protein